jgi:hypothetical protein
LFLLGFGFAALQRGVLVVWLVLRQWRIFSRKSFLGAQIKFSINADFWTNWHGLCNTPMAYHFEGRAPEV